MKATNKLTSPIAVAAVVIAAVQAATLATPASAQDLRQEMTQVMEQELVQPAPPPPQQPPPPPAAPRAQQQPEAVVTETTETTDTNVNVNVGVTSAAPAASQPGAAAGEGTGVDGEPPLARFLHGPRLGYMYVFDIEGPTDAEDPSSPSYGQRYDLRSPHMFLMGYEVSLRVFGHDWLNILLTANVMFAGLEQSKIVPSGNLLLGFELAESMQVAVGASLTPTKDDPAHVILAAGWTPRVGDFYLPVHFFFVPDINGHHRMGATLGVNFF